VATWRDVRRIATALPETLDTSEPGKYAWSIRNKGLAWQRPLRPKDIAALGRHAPGGPIVCVRTPDCEFKELLCASDPAVFFTTPHFNGYPAILICLEAASSKQLRDVMTEAWLSLAPKTAATEFLRGRAVAPATSAPRSSPKSGRSRA
jgi:hypothetical protein